MNDQTAGAEVVPTTTFELLDAAAERGHGAMTDGELPAEGDERDLWHKVAFAVLNDPNLLPAWARAARVDADNWRRQCSALDAELEEWRAQAKNGTAGWVLAQIRGALGTPDGRAVSVHAAEVRAERDQLQARYEELNLKIGVDAGREYVKALKLQDRIDKALAVLDEPVPTTPHGANAMWKTQNHHAVRVVKVREALQGDQPTEPHAPKQEPCPEGYHFVGQRLTHCSECGLPPWEHAGRAVLPEGAHPFGSGGWLLEPWKPGEADRLRDRVLGQPAAPASTQASTQVPNVQASGEAGEAR